MDGSKVKPAWTRHPPACAGRDRPARACKACGRSGAADPGKAWRKWRSRPISRVLSWTVIPLGASSPIRSSNLPGPGAGRAMRSLFGLAPGGVCRAGPLPDSRCALTAPFHPCRPAEAVLGGIFLLHFPSARAAQALPGTVPCGARTFLGTLRDEHDGDATVWPAPPRALSHVVRGGAGMMGPRAPGGVAPAYGGKQALRRSALRGRSTIHTAPCAAHR